MNNIQSLFLPNFMTIGFEITILTGLCLVHSADISRLLKQSAYVSMQSAERSLAAPSDH